MRTPKDLTGVRFNRWTVISLVPAAGPNRAWMCRCDCGTEKLVWAAGLKSGMSQSCGCVKSEKFKGQPARNRTDLTGKTFGRLVVLNSAATVDGLLYWSCQCECGTVKDIRGDILRNGKCHSCGCAQYAGRPTTPRLDCGKQRPEYVVWSQMRKRTSDPSCPHFKNYGGRGIVVCDRWLGKDGFANFLSDLGSRPSSKHTLERCDNNKGYQPDNCKWASRTEQARNKRNTHMISFNGETKSLAAWAEQLGLHPETLRSRLKHCTWSVEKALTTPRQTRSDAARKP